jgi:hypothetical protein
MDHENEARADEVLEAAWLGCDHGGITGVILPRI